MTSVLAYLFKAHVAMGSCTSTKLSKFRRTFHRGREALRFRDVTCQLYSAMAMAMTRNAMPFSTLGSGMWRLIGATESIRLHTLRPLGDLDLGFHSLEDHQFSCMKKEKFRVLHEEGNLVSIPLGSWRPSKGCYVMGWLLVSKRRAHLVLNITIND